MVGDSLITTRAGTRGCTVLRRSRPHDEPRMLARTRQRTTPFAAGSRVMWTVDAPTGTAVQELRPGAPPRTMFTGPRAGSYWTGGDGYIAFNVGGWPQTLAAYSITHDKLFRVTDGKVAYDLGSPGRSLAWSGPAPVDATSATISVAEIR